MARDKVWQYAGVTDIIVDVRDMPEHRLIFNLHRNKRRERKHANTQTRKHANTRRCLEDEL